MSKILKIAGIVIGSLLLIGVVGFFILDRNAEKIVENLLTKEYDGSEISQVYSISYDDISLGLISGNFKIKNLKILPKDSFYLAHDSLRFKYPTVYEIRIPKLAISGIDKNFSMSLETILLGEIDIFRPDITLVDYLTKKEKQNAKNELARRNKAKPKSEGKIKSFSLQRFHLGNGIFRYFDRNNKKEIFSSGNINVSINNLEIQSGEILKAFVTHTLESAQISIGDLKYPTSNGLYIIKVGEVLNASGSRNLQIRNFELIPQYDKLDFGKKVGVQTDRMQISVADIKINGFDVERFMLDGSLHIEKILIDGLDLNAFRDKNVAFDYDRFPKMPQQALAALKTELNISEVNISNSKVLYEQLGLDASKPGQVPISNLSASLRNITNVQSIINKNGPMTWDMQALLFDVGKLDLHVDFSKNISEPDFSFSGLMKHMDMIAFNQMIENTEYIRIESGVIQSMTFEAHANSEYVEGELVMIYDGLQIAGLRKISTKEKNELGLLSALANVVIRRFNPPKKSEGEPLASPIFYERDKNKGIFNYLAKGLISGIKATILPSISSPKKRYEKHLKAEEKKDARQKRKEERQLKREQKKKLN